MTKLRYQRVLLKLSGEALGAVGQGIDPAKLRQAARLIKQIKGRGLNLGIVMGAGNWWRKRNQGRGFEPKTADYIGITATLLNALALRQALLNLHIKVRLQTFVGSELEYAESINKLKARAALQRGEVVIFAGGTGKPFFTTDTAAAQQAVMIKADILVKLGPVDGVYNKDPQQYQSAHKFSELSIDEAIKLNLKVMDKEAFVICRQNKIPVLVCKWGSDKRLIDCLRARRGGTLVRP